MNKKKCSRCGYSWESRVPNPVECPNCKKRLGEKTVRKTIKDYRRNH